MPAVERPNVQCRSTRGCARSRSRHSTWMLWWAVVLATVSHQGCLTFSAGDVPAVGLRKCQHTRRGGGCWWMKSRLRGGSDWGTGQQPPDVMRTRSTIEKESLQAPGTEPEELTHVPLEEVAEGGELKGKTAGGPPLAKFEKLEPIPVHPGITLVVQRITRLADVYDVDFGNSGVLGIGTFSTVRVGTHKLSGLKYAVKAIGLKHMTHQMLVRLRREIQVLRSMKNPNIVGLNEIFEEGGFLYMVMELATGGELWHFLQRVEIHPSGDKYYMTSKGTVQLDERRVAQIIRQVVDSIAYCHARKVAHRDLKLENLMFDANSDQPTIKLIDFGFCKIFSGDRSMHAVLGSPYYVAPEILSARGPIAGDTHPVRGYGPAADMWSLGVITFMIMCGQAPFDGATDTERLCAVRKGTFTYPHSAKLSHHVTTFINGLLTVDPSKRLTATGALSHPWLKGTKPSHGRTALAWLPSLY